MMAPWQRPTDIMTLRIACKPAYPYSAGTNLPNWLLRCRQEIKACPHTEAAASPLHCGDCSGAGPQAHWQRMTRI